jgi:hypothetical protein
MVAKFVEQLTSDPELESSNPSTTDPGRKKWQMDLEDWRRLDQPLQQSW